MAPSRSRKTVDEARKALADVQIRERQSEVKYDLRDFTIDYIITKFREGLFYVPDYQREFVWSPSNRCLFIESVLLGLPIPMMFVADMEDGRLEIVAGILRHRRPKTRSPEAAQRAQRTLFPRPAAPSAAQVWNACASHDRVRGLDKLRSSTGDIPPN